MHGQIVITIQWDDLSIITDKGLNFLMNWAVENEAYEKASIIKKEIEKRELCCKD